MFLVVLTAVTVVVSVFVAGFLGSVRSGDETAQAGACPLLTDADARQVLGGHPKAIGLSGVFVAVPGILLDDRALDLAPDCWIREGERAWFARVARTDGRGSRVFAGEKFDAQRTWERPDGKPPYPMYFAGDVSGLGDEAFCTALSRTAMAGVVVRQGDTVVYASVSPPGPYNTSTATEVMFRDVVTAPDLCALAQELARKVLERQ
jgi:hypothetical protein